jgi:hypothetical protein
MTESQDERQGLPSASSWRRKEIPDFDIDPETLTALQRLALEKGLDFEQVVWTALDQYILREKGANN